MLKIGIPNNSGISPRTGNIVLSNTNKYQDGELSHIKVLENLGGGKLIIDLKGHRIVANTRLMLENGQELDVIVKNAGNQIELKIASPANYESISLPIVVKTPIAEILSQLMSSLEKAFPIDKTEFDEKITQLLQRMKGTIRDIPVDASKPDLVNQIRTAIEKIGYGYERKIADAIANGKLPIEESQLQLKSELLDLQSFLSESQLEKNIRNELMTLVRNALENIEFQQIKSLLHSDNVQDFHFQIPVIMQDDVTTAELELFRRKADSGPEDNTFSIVINLNLQLLGGIAFIINVNRTNIDCQVKADNSETLKLVEENSVELRNNLAALGYEVNSIQCIKETQELSKEKPLKLPARQNNVLFGEKNLEQKTEDKQSILSKDRIIDNIDIIV